MYADNLSDNFEVVNVISKKYGQITIAAAYWTIAAMAI